MNIKANNKKDKIQSQRGVTLLVLVVTIIILLILAGITIGAITGDNGIIQNAGKAREEAEIANEKEYQIWCIEDLVEWSQNYAKYQNAYIELGKTLNFKSRLSYTDGKILNCNSIDELREMLTNTSGSGFTPINNFKGNFDGKNFEIQNIYENISGNAGLFANAGGTIKNLKISGNIISTDGYAGGIASSLSETLNISNCINYCNVTANAEINTDLSNTNIYGTSGGIIGRVDGNIIINDCANEGEIYGTNEAGGMIGFAYVSKVTILNCYNSGVINGENDVGGMIGWTLTASSMQIYNCYNIGDVSGVTAGGLIGNRGAGDKIEIKNCYDYAEIKGSKYLGTPIYCEDISDNDLVNQLNNYVSSITEQNIPWRSWILGIDGYPVFEEATL